MQHFKFVLRSISFDLIYYFNLPHTLGHGYIESRCGVNKEIHSKKGFDIGTKARKKISMWPAPGAPTHAVQE